MVTGGEWKQQKILCLSEWEIRSISAEQKSFNIRIKLTESTA